MPPTFPRLLRYEQVADQLLIDAKPPKEAELPGGNGLAFDWRLLAGRKYWQKPWMLAGGLTPDNVAEAIRMTGARQVDVSSGVESAPGEKDAALIESLHQGGPRRPRLTARAAAAFAGAARADFEYFGKDETPGPRLHLS